MIEENSYIEYPISLPKCKKCEEIDGYCLIIASESKDSKRLEIIKLQNEYDPYNCLYRVIAVVKWNCPSCGIPIEGISQIREIPLDILKEAFERCTKCGSKMRLINENISLQSEKDMSDLIEISGEMVCDMCRSNLSISRKFSMNFAPIWSCLQEIKVIKLGLQGIEIERK